MHNSDYMKLKSFLYTSLAPWGREKICNAREFYSQVLANCVRGKRFLGSAFPLTLFSSVRNLLLTLKTDLSLKGRGVNTLL